MAISNWKDLLGEANALFVKAKGIAADPEATEEQKSHLQEIIDDARAKKERAMQLKEVVDEARETIELQQKNDGFEHAESGPVSEFKTWGDFLNTVWLARTEGIKDERLEWIADEDKGGHETKEMSGITGAGGGYLIAEQFIPQLQALQAEAGIMRGAGATVIRMRTRSIALPVLDQTDTTAGEPHWFGGMKFYWQEEAEEHEETEAEFRRVRLVAKKLTGYTNATDELMSDSAIPFGDFLTSPLGFAGGVTWMEDYAFMRGVGGGQPLGFLNADALLTVARQGANAIDYVDAITMLQNFLPSGSGTWIASQNAMSELIQMSGPSGNPSYVWQPSARDGIPGYLFGMPVRWSEKVPALGTKGDLNLIDARYYIIGDREQTTLDSTKYHRWIQDETSWKIIHRVDGQPWMSAPMTYQDGETQVSPFVALGDAASS